MSNWNSPIVKYEWKVAVFVLHTLFGMIKNTAYHLDQWYEHSSTPTKELRGIGLKIHVGTYLHWWFSVVVIERLSTQLRYCFSLRFGEGTKLPSSEQINNRYYL